MVFFDLRQALENGLFVEVIKLVQYIKKLDELGLFSALYSRSVQPEIALFCLGQRVNQQKKLVLLCIEHDKAFSSSSLIASGLIRLGPG